MSDLAIPILPAPDLEATLGFWQQLGFVVAGRWDGYASVRRGAIELHFSSPHFGDLVPAASYAMCYLRVDDVDAVQRQMSQADLPEIGIPRLAPVVDQPWGMREFHVVDPNGTLVRIGSTAR